MIIAPLNYSPYVFENIKKGLIVTTKIIIVAATAFAFFYLFYTTLNPMVTLASSDKILWRIGSIPLIMGGISAGVTGLLSPVLGMNIYAIEDLDTPMFRMTEDNIKDCIFFILKCIAVCLLTAVAGIIAVTAITLFIPNPF